MISTSTILYIVLLILFILSIIGLLRSDKEDDLRLFVYSVAVFILSIAGAILVFIASIFLAFMRD